MTQHKHAPVHDGDYACVRTCVRAYLCEPAHEGSLFLALRIGLEAKSFTSLNFSVSYHASHDGDLLVPHACMAKPAPPMRTNTTKHPQGRSCMHPKGKSKSWILFTLNAVNENRARGTHVPSSRPSKSVSAAQLVPPSP